MTVTVICDRYITSVTLYNITLTIKFKSKNKKINIK